MIRNKAALFISFAGLVLTVLLLILYFASPSVPKAPKQPIPFSHNVHSGIKRIQCQYCHPYAAYSDFPGIPPVEKCLHCHNYIIADHPWIKKEHMYFETNSSTPWKKVNYLPEHVFFNHQRHINSKISCRECHGRVQDKHRLQKKNWRMGECLNCHKKMDATIGCWLACHT